MKPIQMPFGSIMSPLYALCISLAVFFLIPVASSEEISDRSIIKDDQTEMFFSAQLELDRLNGLISKDNNNADYFYNRGWIYEQMNDPAKAEKDYSAAIEIDKGYVDAFFNRGLIYLKDGRYDLAVKDFSEVIRIKPDSADAFCNRGNAYLAEGEAKNALRDFTSAIELTPQDPDLYYNRALIYLSAGKKTKAIRDMREAARLGHVHAREYLEDSGSRL